MENRQNENSVKPQEIIDLEKALGISIGEDGGANNYYVVDDKNIVIELQLNYNNIEDISPINSLKNLKKLSLQSNKINDLSKLNLPNLDELDIETNRIDNLDFLSNFPNLVDLSCGVNPITDIGILKTLKKLETFVCHATNVSDLRPLENLEKLWGIYAVGCKINQIPSQFKSNELSNLYLIHNSIVDISSLKSINPTCFIHLEGNFIQVVPKEVAANFGYNFNKIYLRDNPITFPPISVLKLEPETVKNYYDNAEQFDHAPLSEGRIIVIGDGSAGKSSLIEKILYKSFNQGREQTNGIKIEHFKLQHPEDDRDISFHIWDFGGQEIQHAVHKFFFTEGCLYVLVLDNRKEEEPDYWLQQIESLGGKAPVLVVFNKQDENAVEIADRKFLKEKYPNIVGFYNTSCKTGFGIADFKQVLEQQAVKLKTVEEKFPKNWLAIKKDIEEITTGNQYYLTYETYVAICQKHHVVTQETQRLLLKYFNTIGAVTWFGEDVHLNMLHVLKPEWITQGVYKILTAPKTAHLYGQIKISDFKELLQPISPSDYTYDEKHYGYILSMMKKFDLCDAADDKHLLIPSAFGKEPKVEYGDFKGEEIRTYILQFKEYMPLAIIHRFTAKKISEAWNSNYWYTGIVLQDKFDQNTLGMVHADKEAKRLYIRIKGDNKIGMWEHIRRELASITTSYAKIPYNELVVLDGNIENTVKYEDLISHLQVGKQSYFHAGLKKDFNVGYLIGLFEHKENTIQKIENKEILFDEKQPEKNLPIVNPIVLQILNNNNPVVHTQVNTQIKIDINIEFVNNISNEIQGEAAYLVEALGKNNEALTNALEKLIVFATEAKTAKNSEELKTQGWSRKLKNALGVVAKGAEQLKNLQDGGDALKSMLDKLKNLSQHVHLKDIAEFITNNFSS